jgi:hypothetical protein
VAEGRAASKAGQILGSDGGHPASVIRREVTR